jgi:hypothetical protein
MISVRPIELEGNGVRLEPLALEHERELAAAAADGALWELWFTSVPAPGYTWYAKNAQRSHVNTSCRLLLLTHAFENVGCKVVGLRTDKFNFASQRAIEALGAKKDGVIRHFGTRRDGSARDVVMYGILLSEWPEVKVHLERRLARHGARAGGDNA